MPQDDERDPDEPIQSGDLVIKLVNGVPNIQTRPGLTPDDDDNRIRHPVEDDH